MNRRWPQDMVDTHVHTAPDLLPRLVTDVDATRQADAAGYRAIVLKNHHTITAPRATLAEAYSSGVRVFGGVALNLDATGGLNPHAVRTALALGSRVVWLPTLTSANHLGWRRGANLRTDVVRASVIDGHGIGVLDAAGAPLPELCEVLDLVAAAGATLATGHVSATEVVAVVTEARRRGVSDVLVTHPDHSCIRLPVEDQIRLADLGGVWFERVYLTTLPTSMALPIARLAEIVRTVGVETTVMASDLGQVHNPSPVEGMRQYIDQMRELGFTQDEIERMTVVNPAAALSLDARRPAAAGQENR